MRLFSGFGQRTAPGWLVVDVGEASVSVVHVVPNGGEPVVEFAEERSWDPADPRTLERVGREFGAKRFQCTTLLKPGQYHILLVEAPAVKREELKSAVRWRIKDMLDYHVDDATIDVLDVPVPASAAQRAHNMYAVAARNEVIRTTVDRFAAAGMPLAVIDIPDTAQRNIASRLEAGERAVMLLTFDDAGGLLTVSYTGELYLARRLDITAAQLAEGGETGARTFERVLVETQRSLDHCERTYPFFTMGRVVLGPFPGDAELRQHLAANLYVPVEPLELERIVSLPAAAASWSTQDHARWLKLIGAGLRVESKTL